MPVQLWRTLRLTLLLRVGCELGCLLLCLQQLTSEYQGAGRAGEVNQAPTNFWAAKVLSLHPTQL